MGTSTNFSTEQELTRVEAAYSKRPTSPRYRLFEPAVLLAVQELERKLITAFRRKGMKSFDQLQILEIGCGTGFWLREFIRWGALPEKIHELDLIAERVADARRLQPQGSIIWYDFHVDNPRNPDVRGIGTAELRALFPGCRVECQRVTLAPPIARPVARISPALHRSLSSISVLRTHYLAVISRI